METEQERATRRTEVFDKVKKVAAMAEYHLEEHPNGSLLAVNIGVSEGRTQVVYITYSGQTPDGHDAICFFSPCREFARGMFKGLGKKEAVELLRRNAQLTFGFFALDDFNGNTDVLMVCSNQLVDTMDTEEFETHVAFVAVVADTYEFEHGGGDEY